MSEKLFWEMHADGRLASLAKNDLLKFYILREEAIAEAVTNSELGGNP